MNKLHYTPKELKTILLEIEPFVKESVGGLGRYREVCVECMQELFEVIVDSWDRCYAEEMGGSSGNKWCLFGYNIQEVADSYNRGLLAHRRSSLQDLLSPSSAWGGILNQEDTSGNLGVTTVSHKNVKLTCVIHRSIVDDYNTNVYYRGYCAGSHPKPVETYEGINLDSHTLVQNAIKECDTTKACAITPSEDIMTLIKLFYKGGSDE